MPESIADTTAEQLQVSSQRQARHSLPTGLLDLAVAPDGRHAHAACLDGVYEVDLESGQAQRLFVHQSYVSGIVRDPHRHVLISAGYDGQLIWYDLHRRAVFRRVLAHSFWSWDLAISPDGKYVASASGQYLAGGEKYEPAAEKEPSVKLFEVGTGTMLQALAHVPPVQAVAISPDSRYVAAANLMGETRVWEAASGQLLASWTTDAFTSWGIIKSHCYIGGIHALRFDPSGEHLLAAGMGPMRDPMAGNGRQLWQRFAWQQTPVSKVDETHAGESGEGLMETLAINPRRPLFVMAGRLRGGEWNAALFSTADGARRHQLNTGIRVTSSEFDAEGKRLYMGGADKQHAPKDGAYPPFGVLEVYDLQA